LVRQLLTIASAFFRSVAEGLSKASRTIVEALSKDCRTSLEQQSNNGRRNIEESCVCTHAMVPARSGLGLALGMVVLFSLSMVSKLSAQIHKDSALVYQNPSESFTDRLVDQTARQLDQDLRGLVIGDTLPESFWNLHLKVVNHPQKLTTIYMENFRDKLLVLDFWANYCKPCVESIDQWDNWQQKFAVELAVIPVHVYYPSGEALPFAEERGWQLPISVGNRADTLLNKLFYAYRSFGQVWIKDGRLLAIPEHSSVTEQNLVGLLTNKPVSIKMNDYLTYFDKRYLLYEDDEAGDATSQEIND